MGFDQTISTILDDTIASLINFDFHRLEQLERQIATLPRSNDHLECAARVQHKMKLLGILLQNCHVNLNALRGLHVRNRRAEWVR